MEQHEVEEVSFLPGEAILNKKAVYEPSKSQRFRQIVCSRGIAICILLGMGATMIGIALIASFARPSSANSSCTNNSLSNPLPSSKTDAHSVITKPTFISTSGEEFPWKELRLPRSVLPVNYDIFLHPNITQSYFNGTVRMTLRIVQKTDFVVFHTRDLNISRVSVQYTNSSDKYKYSGINDESNKYNCGGKEKYESAENMKSSSRRPTRSITIKKKLEYVEYQQYYIQLGEELPPGQWIDVVLRFRGSFADLAKMTGFYKSGYTVNGEQRYMVSTQFEASSARNAFPCMDEPDLKASFSLSIVRDPGMITLFNTNLSKSEPYQSKGLMLDIYESTVCMSTYLVAFVVTDFKFISKRTKDGVMVRVFAPEDKIYMGKFALNASITIIEKYNDFFGIAYPLAKQDLIAIPNFAAGAMENWGLITYRDTEVLYDPKESTASTKKRVAEVVAHELAHQWFGNLVTMKWWNDLWLNEGFASYVENIGAQTVDPSFHMFESMASNGRRALVIDSLSSSHPIEVKVSDPVEVEAAFNTITYNKGSNLVHMLKGAIGAEEFHKGLNYYLKVHAYSNAETKQLWEAFEKHSHLDKLSVADFMDTWTQQMGYPVVTVTRNKDLIYLTQERFLLNNDSDSSKYSWHIPFKYKLSDNTNETMMVWMKRGDASIHLPTSSSVTWIKGNANSEGFYRVNYDAQGWKAIIVQLMNDHTVFSVLDRMSLIDDAFNLAQSGRLGYSTVLDLCKYLVKETDYYVWQRAFTNFYFLRHRLFLHEVFDDLKAYILHLAQPLVDRIGWEPKESFTQRLLQTSIISAAVSLEYQPAVHQARGWFQKWIDNENVELNNDMRNVIYHAGVSYSTKAEWDIVYERYMTSIVPSNKHMLMTALSYSRDARVLQILLDRSLDTSQVKSQSTVTVLSDISANPNGKLYAWRFLRQHWDQLFERYGSGSFTLSSLIKNILEHFSTQFDLDEVTSFFQDKDLGSAKNAYQQAKDVIKAKITWEQHHLASVTAWLKNYTKTMA